jgi:hypothetical protein
MVACENKAAFFRMQAELPALIFSTVKPDLMWQPPDQGV